MRRVISRPLTIDVDKQEGLVTISQSVDFEDDSVIELPWEQVGLLRQALQEIEEAEGMPRTLEALLGDQ